LNEDITQENMMATHYLKLISITPLWCGLNSAHMAQPNYKMLASAELAYLVISVRQQFNGWNNHGGNPPFNLDHVIIGHPDEVKRQFKELKQNEREFLKNKYPGVFGGSNPRYRLCQVTQAKLYTQGRVQKLRCCKPGCCF
jgi:hypothetical protein